MEHVEELCVVRISCGCAIDVSVDSYHLFVSSRRRHSEFDCDWSSDVCSSDLDTENSPEVRDIARARGYRSLLLSPLMSKGKPIGVISVTRAKPGTFADHDVQLLKTFADQADRKTVV